MSAYSDPLAAMKKNAKKLKASAPFGMETPDEAWPTIDENAPLMMGSRPAPLMERQQSSPPMGSLPAPVERRPVGPATTTSSSIPQGSSEQELRRSIRDKTAMRSRVINAALTTNDPSAREALIAQRKALEDDIRPLGAALPVRQGTPESTQASREHLRVVLARERAAQAAQPAQEYDMDPALAAGMGVAAGNRAMTTPMSNPQDELNRQQMLRTVARDSQLAGSGTDQYLTTPEMIERRRRKDAAAMAARGPQKSPEELFPDVTPQEADQIRSRTEGVVAQRARDAAGAGDVLARDREAVAMRQRMEGKVNKLAETQLDSAIASGGAVGTDEQVRLLEGQARLAAAKTGAADANRGAATSAARLDTESFGQNVQMVKDVLSPIFGSGGFFSSEVGQIGNLVGQGSLLEANQRVQSFASTLIPRVEELAKGDPVAARDLAVSVLNALPPLREGQQYDGSTGGENGKQLAQTLNALRARLHAIIGTQPQ